MGARLNLPSLYRLSILLFVAALSPLNFYSKVPVLYLLIIL
jgi:hypothetical protein